MTLDPLTLAAILAMALATAFTRLAGLFVARRLPSEGPARAALEAVPPAVLTALIAPAILMSGPADLVAGAVAILAAWRLPLIAVVGLAVAAAALFRHLLG